MAHIISKEIRALKETILITNSRINSFRKHIKKVVFHRCIQTPRNSDALGVRSRTIIFFAVSGYPYALTLVVEYCIKNGGDNQLCRSCLFFNFFLLQPSHQHFLLFIGCGVYSRTAYNRVKRFTRIEEKTTWKRKTKKKTTLVKNN